MLFQVSGIPAEFATTPTSGREKARNFELDTSADMHY